MVRPIKSRKSPYQWFEYSTPGVDGQDVGKGVLPWATPSHWRWPVPGATGWIRSGPANGSSGTGCRPTSTARETGSGWSIWPRDGAETGRRHWTTPSPPRSARTRWSSSASCGPSSADPSGPAWTASGSPAPGWAPNRWRGWLGRRRGGRGGDRLHRDAGCGGTLPGDVAEIPPCGGSEVLAHGEARQGGMIPPGAPITPASAPSSPLPCAPAPAGRPGGASPLPGPRGPGGGGWSIRALTSPPSPRGNPPRREG